MKDSFPPHFQARKEEFLGNSAGRGGWGKAFSFSARRVISAPLSGRAFVCNLAWSRAGSGEGSLHAAPRGAGGVHEDPHPEQPSCPPLHLDPPYYTVLPTSSSRSVAAQPPITSHCCVQPAEFLPTPSHGPHHCWDMPVGHPSNGAGRTPTPPLCSPWRAPPSSPTHTLRSLWTQSKHQISVSPTLNPPMDPLDNQVGSFSSLLWNLQCNTKGRDVVTYAMPCHSVPCHPSPSHPCPTHSPCPQSPTLPSSCCCTSPR